MDLRYWAAAAVAIFVWQYYDVKSDVKNLYESQAVLYENQNILLESQNDLADKVYKNHPRGAERIIKEPQSFVIEKHNPIEYANLELVKTNKKISYKKLDIFCLAKNIYHEARGESLIGRYAVAQVTLNRMHHNSYPDTLCDVVMDRFQFSWANDRKIRWTHPKGQLWNESIEIAEDVILRGKRVNGLENALFYHADYVRPKWKNPEAKIAQIGTHIFYASAL
jgi:spore germination cell wall hydrolase CwlJ-like protein